MYDAGSQDFSPFSRVIFVSHKAHSVEKVQQPLGCTSMWSVWYGLVLGDCHNVCLLFIFCFACLVIYWNHWGWQQPLENFQGFQCWTSNIKFCFQRMTVAFEELRVQAEKDRLEMSFKCESSVYCVYADGSTVLYSITPITHAVSGQTDVKRSNGEQVTLRHWDSLLFMLQVFTAWPLLLLFHWAKFGTLFFKRSLKV